MKVLEQDERRTEYGVDPLTGKYQIRQFLRGEEVLFVEAEDKESALSAARILVLHELVRRDDERELGSHPPCEGCEIIRKFRS